jgi:hypothetical protein
MAPMTGTVIVPDWSAGRDAHRTIGSERKIRPCRWRNIREALECFAKDPELFKKIMAESEQLIHSKTGIKLP